MVHISFSILVHEWKKLIDTFFSQVLLQQKRGPEKFFGLSQPILTPEKVKVLWIATPRH
jgi:hypothetical protein